MNTIDIIKSAEGRNYVEFEQLSKEAFAEKLEKHPKMVEYKEMLASAKGEQPQAQE